VTDLIVERWGARFGGRSFPCAVGRGGIGEKRGEGDGVTPVGRHRIEAVLARPDRVPAALVRRIGARAIGPGDGWSDDPADPDYNRRVRWPHGFGAERLRRADGQYDLVAVLDWNRGPVVAGRGSAIFLHSWRAPRRPTAGCVALRPADLAWVLARWSSRSRVMVRG
jgi:L,D-peptidoglycan transpeptidase YkuD (ErfK/YbiS/YcfS/YnhG family)